MPWIPLHVHSQFSILDSTASVKALAKKAKEHSLSALALTDFCNMYGAVDFFKACKAEEIKPLIGLEAIVAPTSRFEKKRIGGRTAGYSTILIAKDATGYRNLSKLSSKAFTEGFYYTPRIDKELLKEHKEGLICICGSAQSELFRSLLYGEEKNYNDALSWYLDVFKDDFYLELERYFMSDQDMHKDKIDQESWYHQKALDYIENQKKIGKVYLESASKLSIPVVATNAIHYIEREDFRAHEILMNVQSGEPCEIIENDAFGNPKGRVLNPKRSVKLSHEHYFKSSEAIEELFSDLPEAIENTQRVADKCNFEIDFTKRFYPVFVPPTLENKKVTDEARQEEAANYLRQLCFEGIDIRYNEEKLNNIKEKYPDKDPMQVVHDRLNHELEIIISKGMCDYLLIVYDFIAWAKEEGIPVGPGRGSGAGSIILYLIGITDIEPLRFNLFFERFINPERISYPDIDVDICMDRRSEVIEYTLKKYGKEKIAQIITFGTMKAKMAIKDVGRVLSIPLTKVNAIAKLIPEDPNMTLEKALDTDPDLVRMYENDEDAKRIIDLGKKVEGSIRNTGIHAAGLIICGDPLTDHIPVCNVKDSGMLATQYSMKPVEAVGMLKIDFLGLKTLTSIQKTVDSIKNSTGKEIDWVNLPLNDEKAFNLLNHGKTLGVFQLESAGMQELAKNLHIDKFEEIIAVGALYRPGPMEMIPSFINRKHGKEKIEYDHPLLKDILAETYGIMVYQEQVMQIAQTLANYSLGEGDLLRKAMGKKDKDEMARQRVKFQAGAKEKGIDEKVALSIFNKIEKFASYGFNKSHATAYGFLSYVTAYLKSNFPKEWLAALMTCDIDDLTKVAKHIRESQAMDIAILPPDVNESKSEFVATDNGIRFALSAIKGVGKGVVESIVLQREQAGSYTDLYNFVKRIDTKKIGKKVIEVLISVGAFDFTGWKRQQLLLALEPIYDSVMQEQKEKSKGFIDMFSLVEDENSHGFQTPPKVIHEQPQLEILSKEKELLGFFVTGHPMDNYKEEIKDLDCISFHDLKDEKDKAVCKVAFILETLMVRISKTQRKFAIMTVSDGMERFEFPLWPDLFEKHAELLMENQLLFAVVQVTKDQEDVSLKPKWLGDLSSVGEESKQQFEEAYKNALDFAKRDKRKSSSKDSTKITPEKKKEMAEKNLKLLIQLNIDSMKQSHILQLKKLFLEFPGHISIVMQFKDSHENPVADLLVHTSWGVRYDGQLESLLKKLSYIKNLQLTSIS